MLPVHHYRDPPVRGGSAGELITQRELAPRQVSDDLTEQAVTFGLIHPPLGKQPPLDGMSLTHLTFEKEFTEAVEAKQLAQQEAERARFGEEKAEQQKKEAIISVEGDLKQAELIANSHATTTAIAGGDPAAQAGGRGGHRVGAAALPQHHLPARRAVGAPPAAPVRPTPPGPSGP